VGWNFVKPNQAWKSLQFNAFVSAKLSGINILLKDVAISLITLEIFKLFCPNHNFYNYCPLKKSTQIRGRICTVQCRF